jgi:DNA-binding PadR family transcriptional regulator
MLFRHTHRSEGRHGERSEGRHGKHESRDGERRFARGDDWLGREGGRHGRHGGHPGHRIGRFLEHGDLRFVILDLIAEKPRHGYEIIKAIEDKVSGAYSPSPGVVYPTLTMLEELGYASVVEEGGRKQYTLTPAGREFLDQNRVALQAILGKIAAFGAMNAGGPPAAVIRAMENFKLALRLRLSRGALNEEQVRQLAAILDAAAVSVEQV